MNKKGFAISGMIYGLLVLFIILLIAMLAMFNSRKKVLDQLKDKVIHETNPLLEIDEYMCTDGICRYRFPFNGYYNISLRSSNASTLNTNYYFVAGETVYMRVNKTKVEFFSDANLTNLLLKVDNTTYKVVEKYNDKYFVDTKYEKHNETVSPIITIKYLNAKIQNNTFKQVRYVKDCISGNNIDEINEWSEIRAIVKGENISLNKNVKILNGNTEIESNNLMIDDNLNTKNTTGTCVIIDLGRTYNIDYIYSNHSLDNRKRFYGLNLSFSTAGLEYKPVYLYEDNVITVSAFEEPKVKLINNVYVPVMDKEKSKWARLYHFNNKNSTIYWDATAQVLGLYDSVHKKTVLSELDKFKINGNFEFLLEYPDSEPNKYLRWKQSSNFTKLNNVENFTLINNDFNTSFKGLILKQSTNSLITETDGTHYEIGSFKGNRNGINGYNSIINDSIDLWVKIAK